MRVVLEFLNKTNRHVPERRFFVLAAEKALRNPQPTTHNKQRKFEIGLVFASKTEMRRLNKHYRGKDKPTDVLSFPNFPPSAFVRVASVRIRPRTVRKSPRLLGRILPIPDADGVVRLGEILIAPEVARKEAVLFGHGVKEHYLFLFVHGLLHLLGYEHEESRSDEKLMQRIQKNVLKDLSIKD